MSLSAFCHCDNVLQIIHLWKEMFLGTMVNTCQHSGGQGGSQVQNPISKYLSKSVNKQKGLFLTHFCRTQSILAWLLWTYDKLACHRGSAQWGKAARLMASKQSDQGRDGRCYSLQDHVPDDLKTSHSIHDFKVSASSQLFQAFNTWDFNVFKIH